MKRLIKLMTLVMLVLIFGCAEVPTVSGTSGQPLDATALSGSQAFGVKSYFVNTAFYPYVSVYFKSVDANGDPLVNLTPYNVGLMVQGRPYDPQKRQYAIQNMAAREEGFRTVFVIDASASVKWYFNDIIHAATSYIRLKKPSDEVAIIALGDQVLDICAFTKEADRAELYLKDIKPTGSRTPLYDGLARAIAMCQSAAATTSSGGQGYVVQSNIVVISDCVDNLSVFSKEAVLSKLGSMNPPIPIYCMALVDRVRQGHLDMAAVTTASFGKFFPVNSSSSFVRISDRIQSINRADYVVTFRAYQPVDGNRYAGQLIINYEGRGTHDEFSFQTMQVPMLNKTMEDIKRRMETEMPPLPLGVTPYMDGKADAQMGSPGQSAQAESAPARQPVAKSYGSKAKKQQPAAPSVDSLPGR